MVLLVVEGAAFGDIDLASGVGTKALILDVLGAASVIGVSKWKGKKEVATVIDAMRAKQFFDMEGKQEKQIKHTEASCISSGGIDFDVCEREFWFVRDENRFSKVVCAALSLPNIEFSL